MRSQAFGRALGITRPDCSDDGLVLGLRSAHPVPHPQLQTAERRETAMQDHRLFGKKPVAAGDVDRTVEGLVVKIILVGIAPFESGPAGRQRLIQRPLAFWLEARGG